MSGEMGYRFCARCGRQLMRDQEGAVCLSCSWRPPAAGDARSALEASTEDLTGHWRQRIAALDRRIAAHEQEIADIKAERAKFERLIHVLEIQHTAKAPRRPAAASGGTGEPWVCPGCGWKAAGKYPGRHPSACVALKAQQVAAAPLEVNAGDTEAAEEAAELVPPAWPHSVAS